MAHRWQGDFALVNKRRRIAAAAKLTTKSDRELIDDYLAAHDIIECRLLALLPRARQAWNGCAITRLKRERLLIVRPRWPLWIKTLEELTDIN
jgi:hypothetical protein